MKRRRVISNFEEVIEEVKSLGILKLKFMFPELKEAKRRGSLYFIKCPFHQETVPSCCFFDNCIFRRGFCCYGCFEAGTVIDYYMKRTGYPFRKSVIDLCKIFKIKIEWKDARPNL